MSDFSDTVGKFAGAKALFCLYDWPNKVGGPNIWAMRLLPELARSGWEVEVAALCHCEPGAEYSTQIVRHLKGHGIKVHAMPYTQHAIDAARWLLRVASQCQPDIFIANCVVSAFYAGRYLREQDRPSIIVLHSDDPFHHSILEMAKRHPAFLPSRFVAVSRQLADLVVTTLGCDAGVSRIPYGVPVPDRCTPNQTDLTLLYAGRFVVEQKQILQVTRALITCAETYPSVRAVLCGDGTERTAMLDLVKKSTAGNRVQVVGPLGLAEVQDLMLRSGAIVLLSDYEGLPIALMEGMACGLVPIVTDMRSGIPELVKDGQNGMVVSDRGPSFLEAVGRLQQDQDLRRRLGQNARKTIIERYSDAAGTAGWLGLFQELSMKEGRSRRPFVVPRRIRVPPVVGALGREDVRFSIARAVRGRARRLRDFVTGRGR